MIEKRIQKNFPSACKPATLKVVCQCFLSMSLFFEKQLVLDQLRIITSVKNIEAIEVIFFTSISYWLQLNLKRYNDIKEAGLTGLQPITY